jgi:hypothetical protein
LGESDQYSTLQYQLENKMIHTSNFNTVPLPKKTASKVQSSLEVCIQTNTDVKKKSTVLTGTPYFLLQTNGPLLAVTRLHCWQAIIATCPPQVQNTSHAHDQLRAVEAVGSAVPLPIDRARDAKYRNIAAGQGKAPTLKCRAFFPEPHPTRNAVYAKKKKTIYLFHGMKKYI